MLQYLDMVLVPSSSSRQLAKAVLLLILVLGCFTVTQTSVFAAGCDTGEETCGDGERCFNDSCVPVDPVSTKAEPLGIKSNRDLLLLQPLDGTTGSLTPRAGIGIFFEYFNLSWPWILGVGAGIGVLQALIGGIQVMLSGSDGGMRESGKGKIMWALAGMLMVGLAGFILRSINPIFFK